MDEVKKNMYKIVRKAIDGTYTDDEAKLYLHLTQHGISEEIIKNAIEVIRENINEKA